MSTPISTAAVLGAGTMGHGIAHVAAASGMKVVLYDIDQSAAERGLASIQQNLEKGVAKNKITEEANELNRQQVVIISKLNDEQVIEELIQK